MATAGSVRRERDSLPQQQQQQAAWGSGLSYFTVRERQELMALLRPPVVRVQSLKSALEGDGVAHGVGGAAGESGRPSTSGEGETQLTCGAELIPSKLPPSFAFLLSETPKKLDSSTWKQSRRIQMKASKNSAFSTIHSLQRQQALNPSSRTSPTHRLDGSPAECLPLPQNHQQQHAAQPRQNKSKHRIPVSAPLKKEGPPPSNVSEGLVGADIESAMILRWQRMGRRKSQWTEQEDKTVCELVEKFGLGKWKLLALHMSSKTPKQIHARWRDYLRPGIRNDKPWTLDELRQLATLHQKLGNQWTDLAGLLPGRSANAIKNRINAARRRRRMSNETERQIWAYLKEEGDG